MPICRTCPDQAQFRSTRPLWGPIQIKLSPSRPSISNLLLTNIPKPTSVQGALAHAQHPCNHSCCTCAASIHHRCCTCMPSIHRCCSMSAARDLCTRRKNEARPPRNDRALSAEKVQSVPAREPTKGFGSSQAHVFISCSRLRYTPVMAHTFTTTAPTVCYVIGH